MILRTSVLMTFRTYGSWLHGDPRGSVKHTRRFGAPRLRVNRNLEERERFEMNAEEFVLSHVQRRETANAFHALARRRGWDVFAANVRTNHAHILTRVSGDPRRAMAAFKAAATHRMRELSLISPDVRPWSRGGSLRFLFDDLAVASACRYVLEEQGVDLGGTLVSDLDQASGNSSWE